MHRIGAHIRALRRRSLEHTLLRVAGLAHVDDFKVMEVRAPHRYLRVIGALRPDAWSVENGVRHKALSAGLGGAEVATTRGGAGSPGRAGC